MAMGMASWQMQGLLHHHHHHHYHQQRRCCIPAPGGLSRHCRLSPLLSAPSTRHRQQPRGVRADALGGSSPGTIFPRVNVRDPYKRLGVSRDASEEEIQEARNFLAEQYSGHERSRESVEAAYDKIIMESFRARKKSKINLKSNLKKKVEESPPWLRNLLNFVEVPSSQIILQRAVFFALMGVWSVMNAAEGGPAFQVAVSLAGCVYLINHRIKSVGRSFLLGFGGLVVGWVLGSILVPVIPPSLFPRSWSLELITSLISYVFMWISCTFLK